MLKTEEKKYFQKYPINFLRVGNLHLTDPNLLQTTALIVPLAVLHSSFKLPVFMYEIHIFYVVGIND